MARIPFQKNRRGFALILVLAFVVLLSVVVLAFFSNSLLQRQISTSSANQAKVDLFAQGALDTTIGDLRQEIVAGSTALTYGSSTLYWPITPASMVPYRVFPADGIAAANRPPNLLKESANSQAFYLGAPYTASGLIRAASSNSANTPRSVSTRRWNASLLLSKATPGSSTDFTPINFTAPDWIYVDRSGNNPTAVSSNTVGRYAYCIYNEGGLLDANVAGYPTETPAATAAHKVGSSFADLTQIGITSSQVEQLVGWRNYASAQPSGNFLSYQFGPSATTGYFNTIFSNPLGFLQVANTATVGGQTDQRFISRQQLIDFLIQTLGANSDSLQYLGTFSRALEQPSFRPDPNRPVVVANSSSYSGAGYFPTPAAGGNNAYGLDNQVNPWFLSVPVMQTFQRNDGSQAMVGEPLVKKRFALNRLCWLTYKGPVASLTSGDAIVTGLLANGISQQMINQGTAANIANYFGLVWDPVNKLWSYGTGAASTHTLGKLSDIQALETTGSGREADFFELLKAGLVAGSLGKTSAASDSGAIASTSPTVPANGDIAQYNSDTNINYQVIQIGANMVDQFAAASYPIHIQYAGLDFYGVEDIPYLYRAHVLGVEATGGTTGAMLLLPEVWNPYDPNGTPGNPGPTHFRFLLAGSAATTLSTAAVAATRLYNNANAEFNARHNNPNANASLATESLDLKSSLPASGVTEIDFNISGNGARDPAFVGGGGWPAAAQTGMSITVPSTNHLVSSGLAPASGYMSDRASGSTYSYAGVLLGTFGLTWSEGSTPATTINYPLSQTTPPSSQPTWYGPENPSPADMCQTTAQFMADYILQYQDALGNWQTYQDNCAQIPQYSEVSVGKGSNTSNPRYLDITGKGSNSAYDCAQWLTWMDPRVSRFGGTGGQDIRPSSPINEESAMTYFGISNRPDTGFGIGCAFGTPASGLAGGTTGGPGIGWYPGGWNSGNSTGTALYVTGYYADNLTATRTTPPGGQSVYFADPDGVVRRGMSGYTSASPASTLGLPLAALSSAGTQSNSRPLFLHRPFRSVAELGYVFSGTPWRNLDFSTVESGASPLLDVFCLDDTPDPSALVAGKVDLNTRQLPVLEALLSGTGGTGAAYKDELNGGTSGSTTELSTSEITSIATALTTRTTTTPPANGLGPLENVAELVGKWNAKFTATGSTAPFNIDGSQSYTGFANDLTTIFNGSDSTKTTTRIERFHEAAVRPLVAGGQTRVWNLLIDLVAQTGRYRTGETSMDNLLVDGERRYWLHLAIDRFTGKVLDEQIEQVNE